MGDTRRRRGRAHRAVYRGDVDGRAFERVTDCVPRWFKNNIDSLCLDAFPSGKLAASNS